MAKKYKLNGDKLDFIAENYLTFRKMSAPKRLYVDMGDSDLGKKAYGFLSRIYPVKTYDKGFTWADFTMVFDSENDRNAAYDDMKGAIDEWEKAQYEAEQDENEDDDTPPTPSNIDEEEEQEQTVDYTPYVVVGAAVLIIIVLLWPQN